ncbi:MAG: hypothetical protein WC359_14855 [Dehalococcoidia bacterium]|jgi:hypothetical protein
MKQLKICCEEMKVHYKTEPDDGIFVSNDRVQVGYEGHYGFTINYCPFCGKKVELEEGAVDAA